MERNEEMEHNEEMERNEGIEQSEALQIPNEPEQSETTCPDKPAKAKKINWIKLLIQILSYLLVIAVTAFLTLSLFRPRYSKLTELQSVIEHMFVGEYDKEAVEDMAARGMVAALPDRWSFYLSKDEWEAYQTEMSNYFVGICVTVQQREDGIGEDITAVTSGGPAEEAGIQVGDTIVKVDGVSIAGMSATEARERIVGEENTQVQITVRRGDQELDFTITRKVISLPVATGTLLEGNVGLIRIENFNTNCAQETIAAIEKVRAEGATALVFDVRNNPGGYVNEMVEVLDYLLPACVVFRQEDYRGNKSEEHSDANCVEMPMAVLVNGDSYSAAEFFAACLREYDKAIVVGEKTIGKGYYQQTILLSDGSAVNLSTGKYFTPKGINLTEVGGLTPDVPIAVNDELAAKIYAGALEPAEDPQLQAAIGALVGTNG